MSEQDLDRNEDATPYKLQKAREKGQVAKSADMVSLVVFSVAMVFLYWRGLDGIRHLFQVDFLLLNRLGHAQLGSTGIWQLLSSVLLAFLYMLLPFMLALMVSAIVANVLQTGPVLSFEPLKFDFSRLNPASGIKKFFSMRSLFDAARTCLKLILLSLVVYWALKSLTSQFFRVASYSSVQALAVLFDDAVSIGFKMVLILFLIASIDLVYSRYEFAKKMRMSKRDIKDEMKNRDGDPRIRSRLRELRREMLKRSLAAAKTKDADVLITNPTHIAIALRYKHGAMDSPQLIAKGAGSLAASMRKVAAKHGVPVVPSKGLARKLFKEVDFDQYIPPHLYADVARIMIWVLAMRERAEVARRELH